MLRRRLLLLEDDAGVIYGLGVPRRLPSGPNHVRIRSGRNRLKVVRRLR